MHPLRRNPDALGNLFPCRLVQSNTCQKFDGKFCPQDDDNETLESLMALAVAVGALEVVNEQALAILSEMVAKE
jgi:hypothetical protein